MFKAKTKILFFLFAFLVVSCDDPTIPKPVGFMRIELEEPTYTTYTMSSILSFDLSNQAVIEELSQNNTSILFNISYPKQKAKIHLAYNSINDNLRTYLEETRKLTYQHHAKATNINKKKVLMPESKVYGMKYNLTGEVASASQFYLTDSTHHFFRGALYFWAKPNEDSLAPVLSYINRDIERLIESFSWEPQLIDSVSQ